MLARRTPVRLLIFLFAASVLVSTATAAQIGSVTVTNAQHFGQRGNANNTVSNVIPAASGAVRQIRISGTLTDVSALAWSRSLRVQPSGNALATGPGTPRGQGYFQFSGGFEFTGTIPVSATVLAPGGFDASQSLRLEAYSVDSEGVVPGLDGTSTLTYAFDDALSTLGAEFNGALSGSDPTYQRAANFNADPFGTPVLDLSTTATAVFYDVQPFYVATDGTYAMGIAAGFDTYLAAYSGSFNPAAALTNLINANNEGINVLRNNSLGPLDVSTVTNGISRLDLPLTANTQYFLVTSSLANGTTGNYLGQIVGPGAVTLGIVPEPGMMSAVVWTLCLHRRPRPQRNA